MREEAEAWHDAESVDGRRRCVLRAVGRACARARSGGFMELMLDVPVVRFAGRPESWFPCKIASSAFSNFVRFLCNDHTFFHAFFALVLLIK